MGDPSPANIMCPPQISSSAAPISVRVFWNTRAYKTCGISSHASKRRADALSTNCISRVLSGLGTTVNRGNETHAHLGVFRLCKFADLADGSHRQDCRLSWKPAYFQACYSDEMA